MPGCSCCCFFTFCAAASTSCQKQRRPSRYLVPKGYVGWVKILFKVKDAPPLSVEDGHYLFKIPTDGKLETSSDIEFGVASDDYYYYSEDTRERRRDDLGGIQWQFY
ncbi:MAG TPA: hypothetical protein VFB82_03615 [Blastocatellia bacterium]|nr:hypothetical protein [Blastocatellia bacterium]